MLRYQVDFSRLGRNKNAGTLVVDATDRDDLADKIYRHAKRHLASTDINVIIYSDGKDGTIFCGTHVGGRFSIKQS